MFAKQITQELQQTPYVELFEERTMIDVNGNEVIIPTSIGQFSKQGLENEKAGLNRQIALIDEKIAAIDAITQ